MKEQALSRRDILKAMGVVTASAALLAACGPKDLGEGEIERANPPKPSEVPTNTKKPNPSDTPTPAKNTETPTPTEYIVITEVPDPNDFSYRLWQEKPYNITNPRRVLDYGLVQQWEYMDKTRNLPAGVHGFYLSGILLKSPELEGDIIKYKIGIPNYETNIFNDFTIVHKVLWREYGNPDSEPVYYYNKPRLHGSPGGYNVDSVNVSPVPLEEAVPLLDQAIGKQIAFGIRMTDNPNDYENYLENTIKSEYCHDLPFCTDEIDEIIKNNSDAYEVLNAIKNQKPEGYEDEELRLLILQPVIPLLPNN